MTSPHYALDAFYAAQRREEETRRQVQNSARSGTQALRHVTEGTGEIILAQPLLFELGFLHEPDLASGSVLKRRPNLAEWQYPIVNAGVIDWVRDRDLIVGAHVYFVIQCLPRDPEIPASVPALPLIQHSLLFTGVAMKMLPGNVVGDLDAGIEPRTALGG